MKKIILAFLLILFGTIQVYADRYSDNPTRYYPISDGIIQVYVDNYSVKVVRVDPPFYTIDATVIMKNTLSDEALHSGQRFFFNIDKHLIRYYKRTLHVYNDKGVLLNKYEDIDDPNYQIKREPGSPEWTFGEYAFYVAYGKEFSTTTHLDVPKLMDDPFSKDPEKYQYMVANSFSTFYVDKSSIKETQTKPPYYVISVTTKEVSYALERLIETSDTYFYNIKDGSMKSKRTNIKLFTLDGKLEAENIIGDAAEIHDIKMKNTIGWMIGDRLFSIIHGKPFSDLSPNAKESQ